MIANDIARCLNMPFKIGLNPNGPKVAAKRIEDFALAQTTYDV